MALPNGQMHSLPQSCMTSMEAFLIVFRTNLDVYLVDGAAENNSPGVDWLHSARIHSIMALHRLRKLQIVGDHCLVPCSSYSSNL